MLYESKDFIPDNILDFVDSFGGKLFETEPVLLDPIDEAGWDYTEE